MTKILLYEKVKIIIPNNNINMAFFCLKYYHIDKLHDYYFVMICIYSGFIFRMQYYLFLMEFNIH